MSEIPDDVIEAACQVRDEAGSSDEWYLEQTHVLSIARAILAERERCAEIAEWYSQASVHAEWTDEARGAGYYACADVARDIRFPKPVKELSQPALDADDSLPF